MKPPRLVLLAVAGVSLSLFVGCAPTGDVAIKFGSTKITNEDVDLVTDFLCTYRATQAADPSAEGASAESPVQQAKTGAVGIIAQSLVSEKVADQNKVPQDPAGIKETLTQIQPIIDQVATGKDRTRLTELISDSISSSTRFEAAVKTAMAAEVGDRMQTLGQEEGQAIFDRLQAQLVAAAIKVSDIEIDPVFGVDIKNSNTYVDPSLSAPVSAFAKDSVATQAPAEWLAALPKTQRCG